MIKANELRVGNKVYYTVSGSKKHIGEITQVVKTEDGIKGTIDYHYPLSFGEPINLTPEILEKCGFEWSIYHQAFHKHSDGHETYDLNECYPSGYQFSTFKKQALIGIPVKHLHQLQNLYFALTGEELNYTP